MSLLYDATYHRQSDPGDEAALEGWRIMRNGVLWAHRQTLGSARALARNCIRNVGAVDRWEILDDEGTDAGLEEAVQAKG